MPFRGCPVSQTQRRSTMTWSYMRLDLAKLLFCDGAIPEWKLIAAARECKWNLKTFRSAARSLGVEMVENGGQTWWRLPKNVVPFRRAHAACSPTVKGNVA